MTRIKNISLLLQWTFGAYLVLLPLGSLFFWIVSALVPWEGTLMGVLFEQGIWDITVRAVGKTYSIVDINFSWAARLIGLIGDFSGECFKWVAALYVFMLLKLYVKEDIFSKIHAHYFKRIGQFILLYGTLGLLLGGSFHSIAVTFNNPPGERILAISFGTPNLTMLVMASVITLIGWVTLEGFKILSEQDLTI